MKGMVFNQLQEFVEKQAGFELWDQAINQCQTSSEGIFFATENYPDDDLFQLVGFLSETLKVDSNALVRQFGQYLFSKLMPMAPPEAQACKDLKIFLHLVEHIIHVEVLKLYQDANLPSFDYQNDTANHLTMIYRSPRKLCYLSEGLMLAAAEHFNEKITITQSQCMHDGAESCHIEIHFL